MSDLESKKGEKSATPGHSVQQDASLDIENALSFIDSKEYQETPSAIPGRKSLKSATTPAVQTIPQKDSSTARPGNAEPLRLRKVEQVSIKKTAAPLKGTDGKKTGKILIVCVGVAVLTFLVVIFLYKPW